jgi:transcription initiation factor IIE alpha subunit
MPDKAPSVLKELLQRIEAVTNKRARFVLDRIVKNGVVTTEEISRAGSLRANISETVLVLLINEQGEKEKGRDEREFSWFCFFCKLGCHGTERRRAWRAEAEWSGSPSGRRSGADLAA